MLIKYWVILIYNNCLKNVINVIKIIKLCINMVILILNLFVNVILDNMNLLIKTSLKLDYKIRLKKVLKVLHIHYQIIILIILLIILIMIHKLNLELINIFFVNFIYRYEKKLIKEWV